MFSVAKDSSNPVFLKLVLHGLAADWKVDRDLLVASLAPPHQDVNYQLETSISDNPHNSEDNLFPHTAERQIPFQRTPSPMLSPDLCYASAESLSSVGK